MKKIITLLFAVIFILFSQSTVLCQPNNLIANGGFEQKGAETLAEGWQTKAYRGTEVEFTLDEKVNHSGALSLKARFDENGGSAMVYPAKQITGIKSGQTYKVSIWMKAQDLGYSPNFIAPAVRFNFRPTRIQPVPTIDLMYEMKDTLEWKELTLTSTAPADAEEITLQIMLTKGTIWIDDVSVTPVKND